MWCSRRRLERIETKLDRLLGRAIRQGRQIMDDLTELTNAVAANTDVTSSAILLLGDLADRIAALSADDPAVLALAEQIRANTDALAAAVVENTPAAPPVD